MSDAWMDEAERRTEGRLHFQREYYAAFSEDGREAEVFNDVPVLGGRRPLLDLIQTPFTVPSSAAGSRVVSQLYAEFSGLRSELKEVKTLGLATGAQMAIISSRSRGPVRRLEDLKGAKIRSLPAIDEALETLGAAPLHPLTFEEIGRMLETGELDAAVIGIGLVKGRDLVRQAPYCNAGEGASISMHPMRVYMPWAAWNRLPQDIRRILEEIGPAGGDCWFAGMAGRVFDATIPESRDYILQNGGEFIVIPAAEISRWKELLEPLREKQIRALEAGGLPARQFFRRMLELADRYS